MEKLIEYILQFGNLNKQKLIWLIDELKRQ